MAVIDLALSLFFKIMLLSKLNQNANPGKFDATSFRQVEELIGESIELTVPESKCIKIYQTKLTL
jgi:hypothetical protein